MKNILKLNEISSLVNNVFKGNYELTSDCNDPVAIMVRSFNMHEYTPADSVLCVGRAGAGTNNIPVETYARKGIVVFNTPGANANAVKELVLLALLLASRKVYQGISWAKGLKDGEKTVAEQVEKGKKAFGGNEITGKTLGVYGLGAIGKLVAFAAQSLGMNVIGYDPYLPETAKSAFTGMTIVSDKQDLFNSSDYITLHVPLTPETKSLIDQAAISVMKDGVKIINCARGELVSDQAIVEALSSGKVSAYVTDFPNAEVVKSDGVICIPHLGASTEEAEDNCAVMAAEQTVDYIENGNIVNSVNFPKLKADKGAARAVVLFEGDCLGAIAKILVGVKATVTSGMKKNFGAVLIDTDAPLPEDIVSAINGVEGVIKIRSI